MGSDDTGFSGRPRTPRTTDGPDPGAKSQSLVTQLVKQTRSRFRTTQPLTGVSAGQGLYSMVGDTGFEPVTSSVSSILYRSSTFPDVRLSTYRSTTVRPHPQRCTAVVEQLVKQRDLPRDTHTRSGVEPSREVRCPRSPAALVNEAGLPPCWPRRTAARSNWATSTPSTSCASLRTAWRS